MAVLSSGCLVAVAPAVQGRAESLWMEDVLVLWCQDQEIPMLVAQAASRLVVRVKVLVETVVERRICIVLAGAVLGLAQVLEVGAGVARNKGGCMLLTLLPWSRTHCLVFEERRTAHLAAAAVVLAVQN